MYKILIIEDDLVMAGAIKKEMEAWGNEARYVEDFAKVLETFAEYGPHLVLLDITLPFYNGYHWCSEIRKISSVPVIFISSAADNMNIIMAMNMGGDDFVAKPFDLSVLTAKIQALLRRTYDLSGKVPMLEHRGAILNLYDTTMTYNGEKIELTKNEFRILQTLMENKGRVVSRDTLMTKLWETDNYIEENTLTVNVGRLRKKLEKAGLTLVTSKPEQEVRIMADGRRMWRVFDNLMNNICKYAQSGTRVYLMLELIDGQAVVSFKNISKDPLNISAEELMERFVRGDASRNTEGNGLGLSIARSMTELQGGRMTLSVDGDLFKAMLSFPILAEDEIKAPEFVLHP